MMARRFGGRHSPEPSDAEGNPLPAKSAFRPALILAQRRTRLLYVVPFLFVVTAFSRPPAGMAIDLAAFAALLLSAWTTGQGIIAADAYAARRTARKPAFPRKLAGAFLTGAGLFLGGYAPETGLLNPVIFAVLGFLLHVAAFWLDPMRDKSFAEIDPFQQDRVARVVDEAEVYLQAIEAAARDTRDRQIIDRSAAFVAAARAMCRRVEEDPRDLTAARRYLGVYLMGARDATVKTAQIWAANADPEAKRAYLALLDDLETNFARRTEHFLENDRSDLNVEIDVLRDRLKREGVTAEPSWSAKP